MDDGHKVGGNDSVDGAVDEGTAVRIVVGIVDVSRTLEGAGVDADKEVGENESVGVCVNRWLGILLGFILDGATVGELLVVGANEKFRGPITVGIGDGTTVEDDEG